MTRSQNSFLNMVTSLFSSLLIAVLGFVTRSVFLRTLGDSYLGVEGIFSNILTLLSLTELGFGTAIAYKLYQPLEVDDRRQIQLLMKLYRHIYIGIGTVIAVIGLCLIPALPLLVKDYDSLSSLGLNAVFIFLLYLFNSVSSYWFFAYKAALVEAAQKTYVLTLLGYVVSITNSVAQILALTLTNNFTIYLLVQIFFTVVRNLINKVVCDRHYPYLKEKISENISKAERKDIFKDCYALFFHQTNGVILNTTDTLVLSASVGTSIVGLYANYLSIKLAINRILNMIQSAIHASVGSIFATGNKDWSRLIFRTTHFVTFWLYGIGAIGFAVLSDEFITLWIGERYIVSTWTTAAGVTVSTPLSFFIGVEIFITGIARFVSIFRNTSGMFQPLKYRPILTIVINLVVSVLTVPHFGIAGCIFGTIAALGLTEVLIDPIVICHRSMQISPAGYFTRMLLYMFVTIATGFLCRWLCSFIPLPGIPGFIVHGCICIAVPCLVFSACFCRTQEFRYLLTTAKNLFKRSSATG